MSTSLHGLGTGTMGGVNNDVVSPAATSTWAAVWSGTGRMLRRGSIPLAWAVTLGVCAASAFAVRDVVFPSLEPSASPSLWQPQPGDSTSPTVQPGSTADRVDQSTELSTTELVVPDTTAIATSVASQAPTSKTAGGTSVSSRRPSGGSATPATPTSKPPTSTSTPSSAPTTSIGGNGDDHATTTTTGGGTSTSSPTTVTETTDPATTDTLPGDTGSSGSGRDGRIDDSHP